MFSYPPASLSKMLWLTIILQFWSYHRHFKLEFYGVGSKVSSLNQFIVNLSSYQSKTKSISFSIKTKVAPLIIRTLKINFGAHTAHSKFGLINYFQSTLYHFLIPGVNILHYSQMKYFEKFPFFGIFGKSFFILTNVFTFFVNLNEKHELFC